MHEHHRPLGSEAGHAHRMLVADKDFEAGARRRDHRFFRYQPNRLGLSGRGRKARCETGEDGECTDH